MEALRTVSGKLVREEVTFNEIKHAWVPTNIRSATSSAAVEPIGLTTFGKDVQD